MLRTYQTFQELAEAMTGGIALHLNNCAYHRAYEGDACMIWQYGVRSFAEWLDHIGVKVEVPDGVEGFYDFRARRCECLSPREK